MPPVSGTLNTQTRTMMGGDCRSYNQQPQHHQKLHHGQIQKRRGSSGGSSAATLVSHLLHETSSGLSKVSTMAVAFTSAMESDVDVLEARNSLSHADTSTSQSASSSSEFFHKEACIHTHRVLLRAGKLFGALRNGRKKELASAIRRKNIAELSPHIPQVDFADNAEMKITYELAFAALKYESIIEDLLEDCAFFSRYSDLQEDTPLVMVVLWDFQSRKFQTRTPIGNETLDPVILSIEQAILELRTKLSASLARRRIKYSAPSVEDLLPPSVRKNSSDQTMPVCAWVNQLKISPHNLLERLKEDGFVQLTKIPSDANYFQGKTFYVDPHCGDSLIFSKDCTDLLHDYPLVREGRLIRQDKSTCLAVHTVGPLLCDDQDVIVVNPGSGLVVCHLASLLRGTGGHVVAVCDVERDQHFKFLRNIELLGASKYVKVIQQNFLEMEFDDVRLKNVRVALVIAECSKSGINNAVTFIVTEGEDLKILKELSQAEVDPSHISRLMSNHISQLRQALRLPKVKGVVYLTRSIHQEENEVVVQKAVEFVNMVQAQKKSPWAIIPPLLPFSGEDVEKQRGIVGKYVKFAPSNMTNGCFLVVLVHEPEEEGGSRTHGRTSREHKSSAQHNAPKESGLGSSSSSTDPDTTISSSHRHRHRKHSKKTRLEDTISPSMSGGVPSSPGRHKPSSRILSAVERLSRPTALVQQTVHIPEYMRVVKHPAPFSEKGKRKERSLTAVESWP